MNEKSIFYNPFLVKSPAIDAEVKRITDLNVRRVSESTQTQEGLLNMVRTLGQMTGLLSECIHSGDINKMDACQDLAQQVHEEGRALTKQLVYSAIDPESIMGIVRFPHRLDRVGGLLENILRCCRIRAGGTIPLSDTAKDELNKLFRALSEVIGHLENACKVGSKDPCDAMLAASLKLNRMLDEFRTAHWQRLSGGLCASESSSMYMDILDSMKWTNGYLRDVCSDLSKLMEEGPEALAEPKAQPIQ